MVSFCIIGTSVITARFARAVDETAGARVAGVYSRDGVRARARADEFGAERAFDSLDEALASPGIDAVYVASPNAVHAGQVRRSIEAGVHVLVEKPAVTDSAEWSALVALAAKRGVVLLEAMRSAYDPGTALIASLIPRIGVARQATLRYQSRSSRYALVLAGEQVNMFDPALAGGALNDLGVYLAHAAVALFGVPDAVDAASITVASGVDGAGSVIARYPAGLLVSLEYSKITTSTLPSEIQGEDGTLVIDDIASARRVRVVRPGSDDEVFTLEEDPDTLTDEVRRFVELAERGGDPAPDHARTLDTLRLLEAIRAAW